MTSDEKHAKPTDIGEATAPAPRSSADHGRSEIDRIRSAIEDHAMRPPQILLVLIAVAINAMDGFDILAISFVATSLTREWGLDPEELGLLFSAGLFGMAIGGLVISGVVDLVGRRAAVVLCLSMLAGGMFLSAVAPSLHLFAVSRILTGAGAGGMYTATSTLVFEYSSKNRRETSIGCVILGYSLGTVIGGAISVFLLEHFGWRSIFLFGGALGLIFIPIVLWKVPESLEFLMSRQPRNALSRINRILVRLDVQPMSALPPPQRTSASRSLKGGPLDLFKADILPIAIPVILAKFLFMISQYFILNWTPKLMTEAGFSEAGGISFSIALSIGGMTGSGLVGFATARWGVRPVGITMTLLASASIFAFGLMPPEPVLLAAVLFVAGASIFAASTCVFTVSAAALPVHVRGTGVGLAGGAGRLGSMLGAYMGGLLLSVGFERWGLCAVLAIPAAVVALLVHYIALIDRRRSGGGAPPLTQSAATQS